MPSYAWLLDFVWDVHANEGLLIMVGLGERAIVSCKTAETASFAAQLTRSWGFWGCCRFLVGMPSCTCEIGILWDVHAHGGVLIMVGLGERAILRCTLGAEKKQDVFLKRKNRAMTPILNGTGPLFKKRDLNTLLFHLNPFRPNFLFKKASTKKPFPRAAYGSA